MWYWSSHLIDVIVYMCRDFPRFRTEQELNLTMLSIFQQSQEPIKFLVAPAPVKFLNGSSQPLMANNNLVVEN